jgi:pyruvate dehydrogenase (quinone)
MAVLDGRLADGSGVDVCRDIRSVDPTIRALILTSYEDDEALFAAIMAGASGYVLKQIRGNDLVDAVRVAAGQFLHAELPAGTPGDLHVRRRRPLDAVRRPFGDLMTTVQENLPIKIVVYDNSKLGFVEIEQRAEGMLDLYTDLKNPDFGKVAEALGLWGRTVDKADELEEAIQTWLAQPGPALLNVRVNPLQLVIPPYIDPRAALGMALYSVRAVLAGRGGDVLEMIKENV